MCSGARKRSKQKEELPRAKWGEAKLQNKKKLGGVLERSRSWQRFYTAWEMAERVEKLLCESLWGTTRFPSQLAFGVCLGSIERLERERLEQGGLGPYKRRNLVETRG